MKKVITLFMSILLVFSLVACGNQNDGNSSQTSRPAESTTPESATETSRQSSETSTEAPTENSEAGPETGWKVSGSRPDPLRKMFRLG